MLPGRRVHCARRRTRWTVHTPSRAGRGQRAQRAFSTPQSSAEARCTRAPPRLNEKAPPPPTPHAPSTACGTPCTDRCGPRARATPTDARSLGERQGAKCCRVQGPDVRIPLAHLPALSHTLVLAERARLEHGHVHACAPEWHRRARLASLRARVWGRTHLTACTSRSDARPRHDSPRPLPYGTGH